MEEGNQGAPSHCPPDSVPLKPSQGPHPWTLLSKNLCFKLRGLPGPVFFFLVTDFRYKEVSECLIPNPIMKTKTKSEMHPTESLSLRHDLPWMNTSNTLPIFACPIVPSNP